MKRFAWLLAIWVVTWRQYECGCVSQYFMEGTQTNHSIQESEKRVEFNSKEEANKFIKSSKDYRYMWDFKMFEMKPFDYKSACGQEDCGKEME